MLKVKKFPHPGQKAFDGKINTFPEVRKGTQVYGVTTGKLWFRYAYLTEDRARQLLESVGPSPTQQVIDVNFSIRLEMVMVVE